MYSREFSDRRRPPPPEYSGTALRPPPPPSCEERPTPPREERDSPCEEEGPCRERDEASRPRGLLEGLIPRGISGEDLLLLGLALLLLLDECEDRLLPYLLLFLLVIRE